MEYTPAPINKDNQIASSEYEMKINEENFHIKIILFSENINFLAHKQNSISSFYYTNNFKLDNLKQLSKSFILFDSINDIYNCIKAIIVEGKGKIFYEKENFVLSIPIFLPTGKQELVYFNLNKNKLEKDEIIQNLCKRINELENTITILKENDKIKNEQINDILKRLQILEEKEKKREKKKEEKEKELILLKDIKESSICKNDEISFFIGELQKHEKFINKKIGFKLLFKSSKDGDKLSGLHNKCDNIKSVLLLIKTNKGIRFGGYTEIGFNNEGKALNDNKAFVFSLDKKNIYNNKDNPAIYCQNDLIGFKHTIYIYDNFCSNSSSMNIGGNNQYPCKQYELNNGEQYFQISDIEIFQIFNN